MFCMSLDGISLIRKDVLEIVDNYIEKVKDQYGTRDFLTLMKHDIAENFELHRKAVYELKIELAIKTIVDLSLKKGKVITKEDIEALLREE